jgi:crotonobetainyl-CoA:carnitine CoA-transferase CaiB-like acyl-CoA transferase
MEGGRAIVKSALEGIRIIDLTEWMYGSLGTRYLADMGADVVKIEGLDGDPSRDLENVRKWHKRRLPDCEWNYYFECNNRSKRGMALDLGSEEARQILSKLIEGADVFVTTYDSSKTRELGLDYDSLSKVNGKLIYAKVSGWGKHGPDVGKPTLDVLTESRAGNMARIGEPGDPPVYTATGHPTCAVDLAYAVTMALFHRMRTGEGQEVEVSLFGANILFENYNLEACMGTGAEVLAQQASRLAAGNPLFNMYPTKDKWVYMCMMQTDRWWGNLMRAIKRPDLASDSRFESHQKIVGESRRDAIDILDEVLPTGSAEEWFGEETRKEIELILTPIDSYADLYDDPQAYENQYILDQDHPSFGKVKVMGFPSQFTETPPAIRRSAPKLGEHTDEILAELDYSADDIAGLRKRRVLL